MKALELSLESNGMRASFRPYLRRGKGSNPFSLVAYTSWGFKKKLEAHGMTQSMSRVGKCIDNGPMEGFWGTIKCEKYYLHKHQIFEVLKKDIDSYIYFYNYERLQAKLNSLSPMEVRTKAA